MELTLYFNFQIKFKTKMKIPHFGFTFQIMFRKRRCKFSFINS